MPKSASDIQAELQAALDQEGADETTHAAALTQAISDLEALAASASTGGTAVTPVSVAITMSDASVVTLPVPAE